MQITKSNPKKFWAYVKNKNVLKSSVGDLKTIDNGIDDMEKAWKSAVVFIFLLILF